jgi:hypothetical protein
MLKLRRRWWHTAWVREQRKREEAAPLSRAHVPVAVDIVSQANVTPNLTLGAK